MLIELMTGEGPTYDRLHDALNRHPLAAAAIVVALWVFCSAVC